MTITTFTTDLNATFMLSVGAFLLSMALTPIYTYFAYRFKFWKHQRSTSTLGEALQVFTKLHAKKFTRHIPTMAGVVGVIAITVVTYCFNWDRAQTWLPVAALAGGAAVGLLDDIINIRGHGAGVAGLGDIGTLFPDTDVQWKDADSKGFLYAVREQLEKKGWEVVNVDLTIHTEMPKLGPMKGQIRRCIAGLLGMDFTCVNVKAKTNEGLGEIGAGEAMSATAIAMLRKKPRRTL